MPQTWTDEDTELLIKSCFVDSSPVWNFVSEKTDTTGDAWENVTWIMRRRGFDQSQVKRKVSYMRKRYKDELAKLEANPSHHTRTKWFPLLDSFVRAHISDESSSSQIPSEAPAPAVAPLEEKPSLRAAEPEEPRRSARIKKMLTAKEVDHFDYIGKHVAEQLKSFPANVAAEAEIEILAILEKKKPV